MSKVILDEVLKYEQPTKYIVESVDYDDNFEVPVLTAGKSFILGYTNETKNIFNDLPIIIFDDFTTSIQFVDFPFKVKSSAMKILKPVKEKADIRYLFYLMQTIKFEAGEHKRYWISKYSQLEVILPPLPIQKAIAEKLDKADALRKKDKELLKYYDELAQSVFIDMFGDPVKNEKGWEKVSLGEICDVKGGKRVPLHHKLVKENTGFPYIKAGNIKNGKVTVKDLEFLLPETQKLIKRYIVDEGDVCITVVGANIGDIGIVPPQLDKANLTENANKLLIKSKDRLLNYFLCYQMRSDFVQQQINKRIMAVGVPKLAIFRVQELEILLPPLNLQSEFSTAMENIELQKSIVKQQAKESENLFQALLQESFN